MQFDKNNLQKRRKLWEQVNQNKINISDLKKEDTKVTSLLYSKDIFIYSTDFISWLDNPSPAIDSWASVSAGYQAYLSVTELSDFPENLIQYLDINLIVKTIEDNRGAPNAEYVDKFETLIVDDNSNNTNWYYSYIIKKEEDTSTAEGQSYFNRNGTYPYRYYIISYISLDFTENGNNLPLNYKQLITIINPKYDQTIKANQ